MNIVVFNQNWFISEWRQLGHRIISVGRDLSYDIQITGHVEPLNGILDRLPADFKPDWLIFFDNSSPLNIMGLADSTIKQAFYSVDTHHHYLIHQFYGDLFDLVLVAQKDYLEKFTLSHGQIEWMPLWASRDIDPSETKTYDSVFVGTLNANLNPDRVAFFSRMKEIVDIEVLEGDYANYFPLSRIVVNQTVKGDLNFRVFEAMRCGALLITEETDNGLTELFKPGADLLTYHRNNPEEAAHLIKQTVNIPQEGEKITQRGYQKVLDNHCSKHRANQIIDLLTQNRDQRPLLKRSNLAEMANLTTLAPKYESHSSEYAKFIFSQALDRLIKGLSASENMGEDLALFALIACFSMRRLEPNSPAPSRIIQLLSDLFPNLKTVGLGTLTQILKEDDLFETANLVAKCLGGSEEHLEMLSRLFDRI